MRFLSQLQDIAGERDLVQALIQAAAVWFDLDARAYRRHLSGRFVAAMWLPGAEVDGFPRNLELTTVLSGNAPTRVSSMADLEQLGWHSFQHEVLVVPLARAREADWLLVVAGPVDGEAETTLTVAARTAGAVLEQLQDGQAHEVASRVARRLADGRGAVPVLAQSALEELLAGVGATQGRLVVKSSDSGQPMTLALVGPSLEGFDLGELVPGLRRATALCLDLALRLTGGGVVGIRLEAPGSTPFGTMQARAAEAAAATIATWLGGVAAATGLRPDASPAPQDEALSAEMDRVRRLSLKGGVLVASFGSESRPAGELVSSVIDAMREELRSSDMLAQLSGGEIAALLVRSSADGVVSAAWRVRKRLERLTRERQAPPVALGHTLYPSEGADSLGALVARAKQKKNNPANPVEGWRFVM